MRNKGSYVGYYPQIAGSGIQGINGIYPLNQTFSLRADTSWPTQPKIISITPSTTSLNETDNRDLTVTVVSKGFQTTLYAYMVAVNGSNITSDDFSVPSGSYVAFTSTPRDAIDTDTLTFQIEEDLTDETPDTEYFAIEIRDSTGYVHGTSATISINDTSNVDPFTLYETSFSLPANTNQGTSWLSSGSVTVTNGQAGSGYWLWVLDDIDGYRSDLQLNDFTFTTGSGAIANTNTALNAEFESTRTTSHSVSSSADVLQAFKDATWYQVATGTTSGRCNTYNAAPPSSGTGIADGSNYFVYFESSGSGSDREMMLRTEKATYANSPSCSFSYALYSSVATDVGRTRLFWIEDAS